MLKSVIRTGAAALLAAVIAAAPARVPAEGTNQPVATERSPAPKKEEDLARQRKLPYAGNLTAIDRKAGTFTVGKRVFTVIPDTKFFRADKAAVLSQGVPGEYLTLSYVKSGNGRWIAQSVYFGGKNPGKGARKKQSPVRPVPAED